LILHPRILAGEITSYEKADSYILKYASEVVGKINKEVLHSSAIFNFGNAQKLLNMIAKHMFVMCYNNLEERCKFRYCHCPMDSVMLDDVWKRRDELEISMNKKDFCKSWGHEDFQRVGNILYLPKRYEEFQESIRTLAKKENRSPIEYDFYKW